MQAIIELDTTERYRINAYMHSKAIINAVQRPFIRVSAFDNAEITLNVSEGSLAHAHLTHNTSLTVNANDNAAVNIIANAASQLILNANNESYVAAKMYGNTSASYTQSGTSTLIINNFGGSTSMNLPT